MTTGSEIHTIFDLFRLLAAHPEYRAELRRHLQTEELLNLPQQFRDHVGQFNDHVGRFDDHVEEFRDLAGEFRAHVERFDRREERVDRFIEEQQRFNAEQRRLNAEYRQDMAQFKGGYARSETIRRAPVIAISMGLDYIRTLNGADLALMVRGADASDLTPGEIASFVDADLVIEAAERDGETVYISMEISYTANRRDTRRAIRNAAFLTRFTGQPARAAVASVRNDPEIDAVIADGGVYRHRIQERDLEPE